MSLEKTDIFVNNSEAGKAIVFYMPDGKGYTLSYDSIRKLQKGEYKATTLTMIVKDTEEVK